MINRVCLIIDAGYFVNIQKLVGSIDILKLKNLIQSKYGNITRGYYFTSMDTEKQQGFHTWLKSANGPKLEVISKPQKSKSCLSCGNVVWVEKGIDVGISTLVIRNAHKDLYDTLVLINGDADLLDGLTYVRDDFNKSIVIVGETQSLSTDLQAISSEVLLLSDHIDEIRDTKKPT